MNWEDKTEVKAGNIGERLVQMCLTQMGFIVYKPVTEGSHKIDYFAHSGIDKKVISCEVKTKRRRAKYSDTGINISHYEQYNDIKEKHNINTFLFFVDIHEGWIYGQWLHKLVNGEKRDGIIYWGLEQMKKVRELSEYEINAIATYSTEKYDYSNVPKYFNNPFTEQIRV